MPYIPTMPKNRIFPAVLVAALLIGSFQTHGQPNQTTPAPEGPNAGFSVKKAEPKEPTEAELLLDKAIEAVEKVQSVSAEISQNVVMLDQKFQIKGTYRKAPEHRVSLKLEVVGLPDASGTMQQVCDGKTFWEYQQVLETKSFRKLDAGAILSKIKDSDLSEETREAILTKLGFGGPEALLTGLKKSVHFNQKEKGELDGRPVWIIRGNWTDYAALTPPNTPPIPPTAQLPSYIPSLITIFLGEKDFWPYKVMLAGQNTSLLFEDTRPIGPDGRRQGALSTSKQKPLVTRIEMVYSDVKLGEPVPDSAFSEPIPKGVEAEDKTKELLEELSRASTMEAARKKAEAASKGEDDSLLNQSIPVPKSGSISPNPAPPRTTAPTGAAPTSSPK